MKSHHFHTMISVFICLFPSLCSSLCLSLSTPMMEVENFTIFIKNSVRFPTFNYTKYENYNFNIMLMMTMMIMKFYVCICAEGTSFLPSLTIISKNVTLTWSTTPTAPSLEWEMWSATHSRTSLNWQTR